MRIAKPYGEHNDRVVASAQEEIRRLTRDGDARHPEEASSISSGLSIVGKIIGRGAPDYFWSCRRRATRLDRRDRRRRANGG